MHVLSTSPVWRAKSHDFAVTFVGLKFTVIFSLSSLFHGNFARSGQLYHNNFYYLQQINVTWSTGIIANPAELLYASWHKKG